MTQRTDGAEAVPGINHDEDTKDTKIQTDGLDPGLCCFVIFVTSWFCL